MDTRVVKRKKQERFAVSVLVGTLGITTISLMPTPAFGEGAAAGFDERQKQRAFYPPTRVYSEMKSPAEVEALHDMLDRKDYDGLEKMAGQMRTSGSVVPSGASKLDLFYWTFYRGKNGKGLKSEEFGPLLEKINEWVKARPKSVTARVVFANVLWKYAWNARGGGYADTVSDQGWETYKQRATQAKKVLENAKGLNQPDPRWYYVNFEISKDLSDQSGMKKYFDEGTSKFPAYRELYFGKALALQPRWFGRDSAEWVNFASNASNKMQAPEGDKLYAQIVASVDATGWYRKSNLFKEFNIDWARLQRGMEGLAKQYPSSIWVSSEYMRLAYLHGDYVLAKTLLVKMMGRYDPQCWSTDGSFNVWRNAIWSHQSQQ